jgi:hypothetical protein
MMRHWQYLKYVVRHKWFVLLAGLHIGPGHWWLWSLWVFMLIFHDWDKFLPFSWKAYARTFYNKDGSKRYQEFPEFAVAWNHHQKWNKHHWQYWLLTWDRGETECLPIPEIYIREMLSDWQGAGRVILGKSSNTLEWYGKNYLKIKLHDTTRKRVNELLTGYTGASSTEITAVTNNIGEDEVIQQNARDLSKLPLSSILRKL